MKFGNIEELIAFVKSQIIEVDGFYYFTTGVKEVIATASIMKKAKSDFTDRMWKSVIPRTSDGIVIQRKTNGYNIVPSEKDFKDKLRSFKAKYRYSEEIIEESLKRYIEAVYEKNMPYPRTLLNFISNLQKGSELASYCEEDYVESTLVKPLNITIL